MTVNLFAAQEAGHIVWTTEVVYAEAQGRSIEGVAIPSPDNQQPRVGYAIGKLTAGKHQGNADLILRYLAGDAAQAIYEKYGFLRADTDELRLKEIPLI